MAVPSPAETPVPLGTPVTLDPTARFYGEGLVAGGRPWRLLRLSGASRGVLERWRRGDVVRSGEERLARALMSAGLLEAAAAPATDLGDVAVVIPVLDDAARLDRLLGQLSGLAVTVVDDGSADPDATAAAAAAHGARWVGHDENRGPAAARNTGARATTEPFLWFVDADSSVASAREVAGALRGALADPSVGAAAPRVVGAGGRHPRDRFERAASPLDLGPRAGLVHPRGPVPYVPATSLLVRREAFGDGFDPDLRVGEDVDLVWRVIEGGWLVRYLADVRVEHPARATWAAWWRQRVRYGTSAAALARRHPDAMAPLRVERWTVVAWLGALTRAPWLSARALGALRLSLTRQLEGATEDPAGVARALVARSVVGSVGPVARSVVRTYGPLLWLAALHPRLRRRALSVAALGTAWRFRGRRPGPLDLALAVADDVAYAVGVALGAARERSWAALRPVLAPTSVTWRDVVGRR